MVKNKMWRFLWFTVYYLGTHQLENPFPNYLTFVIIIIIIIKSERHDNIKSSDFNVVK